MTNSANFSLLQTFFSLLIIVDFANPALEWLLDWDVLDIHCVEVPTAAAAIIAHCSGTEYLVITVFTRDSISLTLRSITQTHGVLGLGTLLGKAINQ